MKLIAAGNYKSVAVDSVSGDSIFYFDCVLYILIDNVFLKKPLNFSISRLTRLHFWHSYRQFLPQNRSKFHVFLKLTRVARIFSKVVNL